MRARPSLVPAILIQSLLVLGGPAAAQRFEGVEVETVPVAGGLYMLKARGGNIVVSVGEDGPLLVDDQYAPLTDRILEAVRKLSDRPVRFVVNTHWHMDHTGGNENMGKTGALIVAHEQVRRRMSADQFDLFHEFEVKASPAGALPVITFTESVTFHWNGDAIHVLHVPAAHTDGDGVVFFRSANVVHMGDVFWNGLYPYIDYTVGGSLKGTVAAIDLVLGRIDDETVVIPGHGEPGTRAELRAFRDMLAEMGDRVRKLMASGMDLPRIVDAKPSAGFDATFAPERAFLKPDRWVTLVYELVSREDAARP